MSNTPGQEIVNLQRLRGFIHKEWLQIIRDPSSIIVAFLLPLLLLFLFGYGVSLDAKNMKLAVVMETTAPEARDFLSSLRATEYLVPTIAPDRPTATRMLRDRSVSGIMVFPENFGTLLNAGTSTAPIQVIVNGTDANSSRIMAGYTQSAWAAWQVHRGHTTGIARVPAVVVDQRVWFNEGLDSHKSIVPGLVAVILTLIGALLTALVVAREWERGTMEALLTTRLTRAEFLIGKLVPYFGLGMGGMTLSVTVAIFLFGLPLRGSFLVLALCAAMFMLAMLGIGLMISTITRNQFAAAQAGIMATMLPAVMLSGFIFDIRSMPKVIQAFTYIVPARYFVDTLKTLFLAGDVWPVILPNLGALAIVATVALTITTRKTRRGLE